MRPATTYHARCLAALCVFSILVSAGCSTAPTVDNADMDPVPLPAYSKGTTFVYSNGGWEKVVEANGETVTWENHRGSRSSGPVDFTFRRSRWQTRTRQGVREFASRSNPFTQKPMALWPLQVGNQSSYIETGRWSKDSAEEKTYTTLWSCEVTGVGKVSVMAGEFDTVEIACKRYSERSAGRLPRLREVRTYHYAPAVGHWVLSTRRYTYDRASRRTELLAVVPPESGRSDRANEKMEQSFQLALEKRASGTPVTWSDGSRAAGATAAVDTFQLPGGTYCRRYVQQVFSGAANGSYYGMACRDEQGRWVVPRK